MCEEKNWKFMIEPIGWYDRKKKKLNLPYRYNYDQSIPIVKLPEGSIYFKKESNYPNNKYYGILVDMKCLMEIDAESAMNIIFFIDSQGIVTTIYNLYYEDKVVQCYYAWADNHGDTKLSLDFCGIENLE